jgi:hypothetical protein
MKRVSFESIFWLFLKPTNEKAAPAWEGGCNSGYLFTKPSLMARLHERLSVVGVRVPLPSPSQSQQFHFVTMSAHQMLAHRIHH